MKLLATILFSFLFIVCGSAQTRNVIVDTNSVVVQPTNFWSADASNARTKLGLGLSALTNTNTANFRTNIGLGFAALTNTNSANFRTNIGLGFSALTNTSSEGFRSAIDLSGIYREDGYTIFISNSSYAAGIVVTDEDPSAGYVAPIGSIGLSLNGTATKYGSDGSDWGYVLYVDKNGDGGLARTNIGLGATNSVRFGSILLYQDGESTNAIDYGADALYFSQNGVPFFSLDSAYGGTVLFEKPILFGGTNAITNTATTRTNLGLGATWLTNTNSANFRTNIDLGATWLTNTNVTNFRSSINLGWPALTNSNSGTRLVSVDTNGTVVSPTNFWQVAPIQTLVQTFVPTVSSNSYATNARNLYVYSSTTNISGVTNTIVLPTNSATFAGDSATVTHQGSTSSVTAVKQDGAATNFTTISNYAESVKFIREDGQWTFYHNISFVEPVRFTDGNIELNKAESRTNLGLGYHALTNTNSTNFQASVFVTNSNPSSAAQFGDRAAWMEVNIITNGVPTSFRVPLYK